jgi:VanZ family protein
MILSHKIILRLPALFIAGAIWILSSQSILPHPKGILGQDKIQHLIAYFVLAAATGLWISPDFWQLRRIPAFFLTALITSVYGALDEVHQFFTPGRDCNIWDWTADTLGAFLGAALVLLISVCFSEKIKAWSGSAG